MNMIKLRKILLLSAIAVLTVIYILQIFYRGKNAVRDDVLKTAADMIEVRLAGGGTYSLHKKEEQWLLASNDTADADAAREISDAVQKIRILGKVGQAEDGERFGLDDAHAIEVKALKDGKILRTIRVGKAASTAMQTYITLDNSHGVLLAAGDLHGIFSKTTEELSAQKPEGGM